MNRFRESLLLALVACIAGHAGIARAADASAWADETTSSMRLIAGAPNSAGIEIKLQPGWKTYWRYPGDSGVPPRFDFTGSDNLASAAVLYPVPHLFTDPTGNSLGYKDHVIFPVRVTPQDKSKPVTLRLHVDYAVCEKLCVPAEGRAELTLAGGTSEHAVAVTAAEARVPKPIAATALNLTTRRADDAAKPLIVVDLAAPSGKPVALFVEGPTPEWALPIPKLAESAANGGRQQFSFELDGAPPGVDAKKAVDLTFTVVQGDSAYEVKSHLDERR